MDEITRLKKLECPPKGKVIDLVIDTDTFNEIDDQFAIAYALKAPERFNVLALYAAPFFFPEWIPQVMRDRAISPEDGMEKSYNEILKILTLMGQENRKEQVYRGSGAYLSNEKTPVESPAARDLVAQAMARSTEDPLYVVAIGAITNVASAILMEPKIVDRMVLVWLGGNSHEWPQNWEFNLAQDVAAARVVFSCGVPLVQLPCMGVVSAFTVSKADMEYYLRGKSELCDYLIDNAIQEVAKLGRQTDYWTRAIWDVTTIGWLMDPDFCPSVLRHSPIPEYDDRYAFDERRHLMRYVYQIQRDKLFQNMCEILTR